MSASVSLGHARDVQFAVSRGMRSREPVDLVTRSWVRCLNDYELDPAAPRATAEVGAKELGRRSEKLGTIYYAATAEMTWLYEQIANPDLAVVLVDAEGVVLHVLGGREFALNAARQGLRNGTIWNERSQGTNGMGTCLAERSAVTISRHEHFFSVHTNLTCDAAPIHDGQGNVVAAIDVSTTAQLQQQCALALISQTAQAIESRALLAGHAGKLVLRFHPQAELVSSQREGLLALSSEGRVVAANRQAFRLLGVTQPHTLLEREISELFETRLEDLLGLRRGECLIPDEIAGREGQKFYALLQGGARRSRVPMMSPSARLVGAELAAHRGRMEQLERLTFGDAQVQKSIRIALKVLDQNVPILLRGETGVGKEVFARALHAVSRRYLSPFVTVNCASIPESLIEAELFGYRRGAFTGANREGRRGKVLEANGGTLFLDEVGDMPLPLQARLLRVLEEHEVAPLGGDQPVKVDMQIMAATHRDLSELVARDQFRNDLYYRLQGLELHMPALRARSDKRTLIDKMLLEEGRGEVTLAPAALQMLSNYHWPGNLRQLRHVLRVAAAVCEDGQIELNDLPEQLAMQPGVRVDEPPARLALDALESAERATLLRELEQYRWNVAGVARTMKVSRNTLYRRMRRLHIEVGTPRA